MLFITNDNPSHTMHVGEAVLCFSLTPFSFTFLVRSLKMNNTSVYPMWDSTLQGFRRGSGTSMEAALFEHVYGAAPNSCTAVINRMAVSRDNNPRSLQLN